MKTNNILMMYLLTLETGNVFIYNVAISNKKTDKKNNKYLNLKCILAI